ncbi:adenylate/guanylate cyclase domain-containing protein [Thermodesulfobacteriota bacterium]
MPTETTTLAILFADIAKSTNIYETLGNENAQELIGSCLSLLTEVTLQHRGTVIKTIGDEIMCTFPSADDSVAAAKEMHQALEEISIPDKPGFSTPNIYVGIQVGPIVEEEGDVFGDAVNVAARMVALAKQRQIITTEEVVKALSPEYSDSANCIDRTTLKGKSGEVDIYEIIWEQQDVTVMLDDSLEDLALQARLELNFAGNVIELDQNRPSATLGRQVHNDIVVNDNRVSRTHARIEYRRGKYVVIDQSSNGTYLVIQGKKSIQIKRDEAMLVGKGIIGLGRDLTPESPMAIHFAIKL